MSGDGKAQNPGASKPRERNDWLDVARGYGMFLVFYGHLIERFAALQLPTASVQFKFIYSFHMPLFFLIAGILARPLPGIVPTFQRGMLTRILPAVVFNLLVVPIWLSPSPLATSPHGQNIGANLMLLFQGRSTLNFLTWFLFCLFVVDLLHVALRRVIRRDVFVFASIIALFVFGQALTRNLGPVVRLTGVPANFWMVHEAVLALAFHQVG
jgi:acyltransferase